MTLYNMIQPNLAVTINSILSNFGLGPGKAFAISGSNRKGQTSTSFPCTQIFPGFPAASCSYRGVALRYSWNGQKAEAESC